MRTEQIKNIIGQWVSDHTGVVKIASDTYEVATTQIDAYGDTVYCIVEEEANQFHISDEGHILFKLDPGETDSELYQTAEEIAIGAGFDFDQQSCEISVTTDEANLAQAIVKLAQLQVAISYLG